MKLTLPQSTSFPIAGMRGDDNCNCIAFFNEKQAFRTKRSYLSTNGQNFAISPDKRQNNKPVSKCLPAYLVGVRRLELLASCSLSKRATNLRYTPLFSYVYSPQMVGVGRLELPASCSRSKRATKLRYTPTIFAT